MPKNHQKQLGFVPDIMNILDNFSVIKADFQNFLSTHVIKDKKKWRNTVSWQLKQREEKDWHDCLEQKPEFSRFANVHTKLQPAIHWVIAGRFPQYTWAYGILLYLAAQPVFEKDEDGNIIIVQCNKCNIHTSDIVKHMIIECVSLRNERNQLFENIIDVLDIDTSTELLNCEVKDVCLTSKRSIERNVTVIEFIVCYYCVKL